MLKDAAVRVLVRVLSRLPAPFVGPISEIAGTLAYLAAGKARDAVRRNQLMVAPTRRPRVRRTFVAQVRSYLEIFQLLRAAAAEIEERVITVDWEHFNTAHARGQGVIMASAHWGPVNLCGQIFPARGYRVTMPVEDERGAFAKEINRGRSALGGTMVTTSSARTVYKSLREGGVLGSMADRAVTGIGERVDFFGRETLLPSAHVVLALRTNAALIPAFAYRDGSRATLRFEPELVLRRSDDHAADVRDGVRRFAEIMERHLVRRPEEWIVFEPVWDANG